MIKIILIIFLALFLLNCKEPKQLRTAEYQSYINETLAEDRKNKELELFYLNEIRIAEENNDSEAFRFNLEEYIKVPRMDIPEWMKGEPSYFQGGDKVKY